MEKEEIIIGDVLKMSEHTTYKDEYVATWRGYIVATVGKKNSGYEVTEHHPNEEGLTYTEVSSLDAAWQHIKRYTRSTFDDYLMNA